VDKSTRLEGAHPQAMVDVSQDDVIAALKAAETIEAKGR
jgi:hypothetical protein